MNPERQERGDWHSGQCAPERFWNRAGWIHGKQFSNMWLLSFTMKYPQLANRVEWGVGCRLQPILFFWNEALSPTLRPQ
jgi:hypothetical protein